MYMLDKHYLENYDASFSENFYGLKRVRAVPESQKKRAAMLNPALRDVDRRRSLFFLVIVPWLRSRMDMYYTRLLEERQLAMGFAAPSGPEQGGSSSSSSWVREQFIKWYPYWVAVDEGNRKKKKFSKTHTHTHTITHMHTHTCKQIMMLIYGCVLFACAFCVRFLRVLLCVCVCERAHIYTER